MLARFICYLRGHKDVKYKYNEDNKRLEKICPRCGKMYKYMRYITVEE